MQTSLDKINQEVKRDTDFALQKLIPFSNKLFGLAETGVAALRKKEALRDRWMSCLYKTHHSLLVNA